MNNTDNDRPHKFLCLSYVTACIPDFCCKNDGSLRICSVTSTRVAAFSDVFLASAFTNSVLVADNYEKNLLHENKTASNFLTERETFGQSGQVWSYCLDQHNFYATISIAKIVNKIFFL